MARKFSTLALALTLLRSGEVGAAPPLEPGAVGGEGRSLLRDADRTRTGVAGEADAAAVVANPANLGFSKGVGGVIEGSWARPEAQRRGSGAGVFVAVPLSLKLFGQSLASNFLALGVGYQHLRPSTHPRVRELNNLAAEQEGFGSLTELVAADMPYNKLSFALAVPLMRWVPGLSVGLAYSRLWSRYNLFADDLNQFDLAVSYRPHRVVALGLVARGINTPATRHRRADVLQPPLIATQAFELDPEVAVRPIAGSRALELAFGARIIPVHAYRDPRWPAYPFTPRARIELGSRGVRVFGEGELYSSANGGELQALANWRVTAGVELDLARVGLAVAPVFGGGATDPSAAQGFAGKLRVSAERYAGVADLRGEALRVDLAKFRGDRGMYKLVELLDRLSEQRRPVVLLEVADMSYGWAQIEEVREAVRRVRARGGKVAAYLRGGGMKDYFLATAADRIYAHPNARLSIVGLRVEVYFFAELLAKLGAKAEFIRVAEYKSRPEQFSERTSTRASAQQRQLLLDDTWNHLLRTVAGDRRATPEQVAGWIDAAPHAPEVARSGGMVDELSYPDELDARVSEWTGRKLTLKGPPTSPMHAQRFGPGPEIAVLHIDGTMSDGDSLEVPIVGARLAGSRTLVKAIEELRADRRVKAVVVRIDSPGGSVACADAIARALELTRQKKPVVISMGNVAASGGYYVATAGQYIFSDALTRTGSIGIFRPKVDLSGTLKLFGVGVDELDIGANAGMYSWLKPYSETERAAAQRGIEEQYAIFTARVARARSLSAEAVDRVARGRVWTGVRAREIGLVDAYGGLREAILHARALAKLDAQDGEVRHYPPPPTLVDQVEALFGVRLPSPLGGESGHVHGVLGATGLLWVLRRLPASVWLMAGPEPLALSEEVVTVE